jgi:methyl-accepting chemotaxis protein
MRLETKLGLNSGILVCAMLVTALAAHVRMAQAKRLSEEMLRQRTPVIMGAREVRLQAIETVLSLVAGNAMSDADPNELLRYRTDRDEHLQAVVQQLDKVHAAASLYDLGQDAAGLRQIDAEVKALRGLVQINDTLTSDHDADALLAGRILPLKDSMRNTLNAFVDSQLQQSELESRQFESGNRSMQMTLWIATAMAVLLGSVLSLLLGRRINRALDRVAERAGDIASGVLTGRDLELDSTTQIGQLGAAMNHMQAQLCNIIGSVAAASGSLAGNAESMRSASEEIHRRIDRQSHQTEQAAAAMAEMSVSIADVSRHTQSAAATARETAQTARNGGEVVHHLLGSMQRMNVAVVETTATVSFLGEDSRRISLIVTVIEDIARKTNLLALNAAIEAARAGDHGRGFAVVAAEVRRLAESTARATGEISGMILALQERARGAVDEMEAGRTMAAAAVVTATEAGNALESIIGMAERVDRMIAQIAVAASQQADAAHQSSTNLDAIHTLSNETLDEMANTARGIDSLRSTAVAMERQVDRFILDATPGLRRIKLVRPAAVASPRQEKKPARVDGPLLLQAATKKSGS